MKLAKIVSTISSESIRILNDKFIISDETNRHIKAISIENWDTLWEIQNIQYSINFLYKNLLCDGSLRFYDVQTGKLIYENVHFNVGFADLTFAEYMLFKENSSDNKKKRYIFDIDKYELSRLSNISSGKKAIFFEKDKIIFRGDNIVCYNFEGEEMWKYPIGDSSNLGVTTVYKNLIFLPIFNAGTSALDTKKGEVIWRIPYSISTLDDINGLIYIVSSDYLVLNANTGEEMVRVDNWVAKQIAKYPALANIQSLPYLSEEYLVFSSRTRDDKIEGGVFFVDKNTAEVKEYFRIVFDKDPVQRRDWDGNKIPDDEQIPFMPLETPIYKDGRLYVVLPSPIEGQKDLYVYEREE